MKRVGIRNLSIVFLVSITMLLQVACEEATTKALNNEVESQKMLTSTTENDRLKSRSVEATGTQTAEEAALAIAASLSQASKEAIEANEDGDSDCD